jgi:hypothetical protein
VFRQLRGFAAYGFNKAHAACFAVVCNASAWLKAHYPAEFFCGLMNNQPMGFYSPRVVLNDARRWGLEVLPVDVNASVHGFSVERDGRALRVGLTYVKEMSHAAGAAIVAERAPERGGPYRSLPDFCRRTRVSVEIVINLVRVGGFDGLGVRREELLVQVPLVHAQVSGGGGGGGGGLGVPVAASRPPRLWPGGLRAGEGVPVAASRPRRLRQHRKGSAAQGDHRPPPHPPPARAVRHRLTTGAAPAATPSPNPRQRATTAPFWPPTRAKRCSWRSTKSSGRCRSCRRGAPARRSRSSSRCSAST